MNRTATLHESETLSGLAVGSAPPADARHPHARVVLVVEDDADYAAIIVHALKREGHDAVVVDTLRAALRFAGEKPPDLAILDVMLPDGTGHDLCAELRARLPGLPVIFLSSLNRMADIIAGLDAGGDDYLVKPFHPGELLARTRALLRRTPAGEALTAAEAVEPLAGLQVDAAAQSATFCGRSLGCTPTEVEILAQLMRFPGEALSHGFLTETVWGYKNVDDATLLKGHISAIRKKLREAGASEDLVRTVHGVGYCYNVAG